MNAPKIVRQNENVRVVVRTPAELFEEGKDDKGKYVGGKWGGLYLRAPDIYFRILEKAGDKLVRLRDVAVVNEGKPTGANDFFFVSKEQAARWGIEPFFLQEGVMKTKGFARYEIRTEYLDRFFLAVDRSRKELVGTNALLYIEHGEARGLHKRKTFKGKPEWFRVKRRKPSDLICPCGIGDTFFCAMNSAEAISSNSYAEIRVNFREHLVPIWASLNSAFGWLGIEIVGRSSLGGGMLKVDPIEYRQLAVPKPELFSGCTRTAKNIYEKLKDLEVKNAFEELGFPLCRNRRCPHLEHPYEHVHPEELTLEQVQKASPDRFELDRVVFDVLGLTDEERLEVYRAVARLVKDRLTKARSNTNGG